MTMAEWKELAEIFDHLATPVIAATSAFFAALGAKYVYEQYRQAQAWKSSDLAASLVARLESDEDLAFARHALDWGGGPLLVPKRYEPLLVRDLSRSAGGGARTTGVMDHDPELLHAAMRPHLARDVLDQDPRVLIYRACFDKLFTHLSEVNRLVKERQIRLQDVGELAYWLKRIARYQYPPNGIDGREMFQPFLKAFNYGGVAALGRDLKEVGWWDDPQKPG